jgi:hypothetical protein
MPLFSINQYRVFNHPHPLYPPLPQGRGGRFSKKRGEASEDGRVGRKTEVKGGWDWGKRDRFPYNNIGL